MPAPFVGIGRIVKAHGLRGEVSVMELTGLPLESFVGMTLHVAPPHRDVARTAIDSVRPGPKGALVTLHGIDSIGLASELAGRTLIARSEDVPDAEEEFDPTGFAVVDEERGALGAVTDVIITGANDVLVVTGGSSREVLIPVIDDVVVDVDEAARTITVRLLPGLLPEDDE